MKINSVNNFENRNLSRKTGFKSHPDYNHLAKFYEIKASSYFRRGRCYGKPSRDFSDVVRCLKDIFYKKEAGRKKMLIAGIGDSQEPFSLLAVIKAMLKKNLLKDNLDLTIVDLQSKPSEGKLFFQSFFDNVYRPQFVPEVFVKDEGKNYGFDSWLSYRVNDEIFEFLKDTYNNPQKSYWESKIQDKIKDIPDETFDVVSINNTLDYIKGENTIRETINHVIRTNKKDGVFITDPISDFNDTCKGKTNEIYKGIFKKL